MKKFYFTLLMAFMVLSLSAQNLQVQPRGFMGANPARLMPTLTEDQTIAINNLRVEHEKEMLQLQNKLQELRAQLRTLQQVDKPNTKAVNSKIDEITTLQNKSMKQRAEHQSKVRALLTDEQKLAFDKRVGPHGNFGMQRGMKGQGAHYQSRVPARQGVKGIAPRNTKSVKGARVGGYGPGQITK